MAEQRSAFAVLAQELAQEIEAEEPAPVTISIRPGVELYAAMLGPDRITFQLRTPSGAAIYFNDPDGHPRWIPGPAKCSKLFRD